MALEMREGNPEVTVIDECALSQRIDLVLREIQIYYGDAHPEVLMVVDRIACLKVPSTTSEAWEMATAGDIASFSFFILFTSGCYSIPFRPTHRYRSSGPSLASPCLCSTSRLGRRQHCFQSLQGPFVSDNEAHALPMAGYQESSTRGISASAITLQLETNRR
ncbi:hypothetical protein P692DRAFT_20878812 [Suillus brevipes Sb2]|nr:hypothetical protein P692DRAFT_20878812 [Suillus brevipes Sb2]